MLNFALCLISTYQIITSECIPVLNLFKVVLLISLYVCLGFRYAYICVSVQQGTIYVNLHTLIHWYFKDCCLYFNNANKKMRIVSKETLVRGRHLVNATIIKARATVHIARVTSDSYIFGNDV